MNKVEKYDKDVLCLAPGSLRSNAGLMFYGETRLAPFFNKSTDKTLWAIELQLQKIEVQTNRLLLAFTFCNQGSETRWLWIPPLGSSDQGKGLRLRYALDQTVSEGVTPLPVEWNFAPALIHLSKEECFYRLEVKETLHFTAEAEVDVAESHQHLAKIEFQQYEFLDTFAGRPIFSGTCYSDVFEYKS